MVSSVDQLDLQKQLKQFYAAKPVPVVVDLPALSYLMVDGGGDPNTFEL